MNFYKHYLGDFQRDTGHLSLTERGAYLALIHHYYATENPLPNEHAALCRIAGAFTKAERDAVKSILSFFELREGMLWHKRIEAELEKQAGRCDKNRAIALAREDRKRAEKEAQTDNENSTNRAQNVQQNVARTSHQNSTIPEPEPEPVIPKENKEGKPSLQKKRCPRGTRLDPDWVLPPEWEAWAIAEKPGIDPRKTAAHFRDYWIAIPGQKGVKLDWQSTWRNWVRGARVEPKSPSGPLSILSKAGRETAQACVQAHEMIFGGFANG
jgi:uncharacterized protein YdaU (DUF1376 family)